MLGSDAERVLYALAVGAAPTRAHDDPDADTDAEARKHAAALAAHSFLKVRDELRALCAAVYADANVPSATNIVVPGAETASVSLSLQRWQRDDVQCKINCYV